MIRVFILLFLLFAPLQAFADAIDLNGFQRPDGAITTGFGGTTVDPYFATKSLIVAMDEKLDVKKETEAWIAWALQMQKSDGLFERYELSDNTKWQAYAESDADDAMSALWIELLCRTAPKFLPVPWLASITKTEARLEQLYDPASGVYFISQTKPVGLLMDNVEIYAAFRQIAQDAIRLNRPKQAKIYSEKAARLADNILKTFRSNPTADFIITTQERREKSFYPDVVAQLYPLYYYLPVKATISYVDWMRSHEKEWMDQRIDDFPWGIVALLSLKMGDNASAACWQNRAAPLRYSGHWNILEEISFQAIAVKLAERNYTDVACIGKPS